MTETGIIVYGIVKFAAYACWCGLGIRVLARRAVLSWALLLGLVRLLMGLGFGVVIFLAVNIVYGEVSVLPFAQVISYLTVYVPVRVVEWGLILLVLHRLRGQHRASRGATIGWLAGGIAVSCLADVPILIGADGLPIGRFLC